MPKASLAPTVGVLTENKNSKYLRKYDYSRK
jgi:hypothetical protein